MRRAHLRLVDVVVLVVVVNIVAAVVRVYSYNTLVLYMWQFKPEYVHTYRDCLEQNQSLSFRY